MTNYTLLTDPQEWIGRQWSKDPSPERVRILSLARDALFFLGDTGQRYPFEDFRRSPETHARSQAPERLGQLEERIVLAEDFFRKLRDKSGPAEDKGLIQVILDALLFISSSDQYSAFDEYLSHVEAGGPPYIVASFDTREAAEDWLKRHPNPPDMANVLVADRYHCVACDRETGSRRLPRSRDLEYYLAELKREKPPLAIASFNSLGEAEAWLRSQPAPARWAWVSIAGDPYLAAYYPNIDHRALYPLSMAEGYEEESGGFSQQ